MPRLATIIKVAAATVTLLPMVAVAKISRPFIIRVISYGNEINGRYIATEIRDPTFGTNIVYRESAATVFTIDTDTGMLFSGGTPEGNGTIAGIGDIGEQTQAVDRGRVYFCDPSYCTPPTFYPGGSFDPLICSLGGTIKTHKYVSLMCTSAGRSDMFGCRGRGEASGWFIYNSSASEGTNRHGKCTDMWLIAGEPPANSDTEK